MIHYSNIAAEMWCLARLLPLIIGEHVPEDDDRWQLFLVFLTIMDYIFAPATNHHIISYVQLLIAQHHARFRELYPECSIIPKQHYLCHVVEWLEK